MQDVRAKLNPGLSWQKQHSFHKQIGLEFKREISQVLHFEHSTVWCSNLDTSESRSEIHGNFGMQHRRRLEKINWIDRMKNEDVLHISESIRKRQDIGN